MPMSRQAPLRAGVGTIALYSIAYLDICVVGLYPFIGLILLNQFNKTEKIHRKIHRKIHIESFRGKPFFDKVTDTLINSKVEFSRVVTN